jgi:hypothetical protein
METKRCSRCGEVKDESEFYVDSYKSSGLTSWCKECIREHKNQIKHIKQTFMPNTKQCTKCKRIKPISCFSLQSDKASGLKSQCKECIKKYLDIKARSLMTKYGLLKARYEVILSEQNGVCAICGKSEITTNQYGVTPLCVDHCGETHKIRGLLCRKCNLGLGHFNDDIKILESAISYLRKNQ